MNNAALEQLADRIILIIRAKSKQKFLLESLAKRMKVSLADINAAIKFVNDWEYQVTLTKKDIAFISAPDSLCEPEISYKIKTKIIGTTIHAFNSVKSTNIVAAQLAEKGALEGTIVTAEKQTLGKGRLGRSWHSPDKMGIYLSIILRPKFTPDKAPGLSIMSALAVVEALKKYCPEKVKIKWPNDVLINGRKVAGILTELDAVKNKIIHVVVGIGINVNQSKKDFPANISKLATSVRCENGGNILRVELLQNLLHAFEKEYQKYQKGQLSKSLERIRKYSSLINSEVSIKSGGAIITGRAVDIDKSGSLIVERDKTRKIISSGEVTVIKK